MNPVFEVLYYVILFFAIYFQVFFLVVFFEKRSVLKKTSSKTLSSLPSVTFLIPCWNEEKSITRTVESVLSVDYPKDKLHIFIIDDGSTDNTWDKLQSFKDNHQITLLQKENGGKHSALNYALSFIKTDLVVSFDADTSIRRDALVNAVEHFIDDPELMALGGAVLINKPHTVAQRAQSVEYQMFSYTKKMLGMISGVMVVPGAFSVFRREVFDKIGGYRKGHNLEDLELTFRIQASGMKVDHCHTAVVVTNGPASIKSLFKQRLRWGYGFLGNVSDYFNLMFKKDFGNFAFFTLPMSVFSYVIIVFVFMVSSYKIVSYFIDQVTRIMLVGFQGFSFNFDSFFIDTRSITLLGFIMYGMILLSIYLGKKISNIKHFNLWSIICFGFLYSVLAPLWILKTIYNWTFSRQVAWR